ncbi:uncharacterized protein At3g27210-like isoform X2 [Papaver somniferum]|uniref:uncharacterized protein At3g27210-like isoform X2 n=1 Tax=Papaver somniferum TaxID=3469 RepID=UPI000E6FCFA9|nr:uncharacterized protein At3g27210-like isoform X2 [Papaver somniferum]
MGSCASVIKQEDSVSKSNKMFLVSSPVKQQQQQQKQVTQQVNGGGLINDLGSKYPSASTPPPWYKTLGDLGSKEETFFDSQAWLDSDCDDFYSVNGEFTPSASRGSSRGSTPLHLTSFMGTPQRAKSPLSEKAFNSIPETRSTEKRKKLADLFRDSFDAGKASDDQNASVLSETNSVSSSEKSPDRIPKPEKEKLTKAVRRCLPKMIPSCSSAERKKRHSMSPIRNGGGVYNSTIA